MTKLIRKIFLGVVVLLVGSWAGAYLYVEQNGKRLVVEKMTRVFRRPVAAGEVVFAFPLGIEIKNFEAEGLLWVQELGAQLGWKTLFREGFTLSSVKLVNPVLILHRNRQGQIIFWEPPAEGAAPAPTAASSNSASSTQAVSGASGVPPKFFGEEFKVVIDHLSVVNGRMNFPDHFSANPREVALIDIALEARDVPLALYSINTRFTLSGVLAGDHLPFLGDHLEARGWLNWQARNMDAHFQAADDESRLVFAADLKSVHNELKVQGNVRLNDQIGASKKASRSPENLEELILGMLEATGQRMDLRFSFPTKMDEWNVAQEDIEFSGDFKRMGGDGRDEETQVAEDFKTIAEHLKGVGRNLAGDKSLEEKE